MEIIEAIFLSLGIAFMVFVVVYCIILPIVDSCPKRFKSTEEAILKHMSLDDWDSTMDDYPPHDLSDPEYVFDLEYNGPSASFCDPAAAGKMPGCFNPHKSVDDPPCLGLATTGELLDELAARLEACCEGGLTYRPIPYKGEE